MSHSNTEDNVKEIHHHHYYYPPYIQPRYNGAWWGIYPPPYCEPNWVYTPRTFTIPPKNWDGSFKITC